MSKRKNWIIRIFFVLFTLSVSVTVIPCSGINTHGLFGEVTASAILEDKDQSIENITNKRQTKIQKVKGINITNIWFELFVWIIYLSFVVYIPQTQIFAKILILYFVCYLQQWMRVL